MKNYDVTDLRGVIEQLPTNQLDRMLQRELEKTPVDEAAVQIIMGVLKERDQDIPVEINEHIQAAWTKYQAQTPFKERPRIALHSWPVRVVAAVAVIVLLAFAMPQNAEAEGFWERLARWTDSIFEFLSPGDTRYIAEEYIFETDNPGLQQVYDTVTALGITHPVVPMWLPEGYELIECEVIETTAKTFVYSRFKDGMNTVSLDIAVRSAESPRQYSKDESNVKSQEIAGIVHNILHNNEWWTAVWAKDEVECAIYVDCQEETLYKILESIYMMEDD